jgi:hypothetical protein
LRSKINIAVLKAKINVAVLLESELNVAIGKLQVVYKNVLLMPHLTCGSAIFYSFRSAPWLRIKEQNNLRTVPEPQFLPAPVTQMNAK